MNFDDMMKQMKVKYIKELPSKIENLKVLVEQKNFDDLESFFHKFKGSGSSYGLPEISEYGAKYEQKAKDKSLSEDELGGLVRELEAIYKVQV